MEIVSDYPINEQILKEASKLMEDYNVIATQRIKNDGDKVFLRDSIEKKCRFCGKSYPEVKFKSNTHAISELFGNKKLFSTYECDTCNIDYFNQFETEMAKFMLPLNSISGTKVKKNKIPKYKQGNDLIIENKKNIVTISNVPKETITRLGKNGLDFSVKIPSYKPEYIYRCLIKIGLSIIEETSLFKYKGTLEWLMDKNKESTMNPLMLLSIYPTSLQMNEIVCTVLEKKEGSKICGPYSILFLSYRNYAFQTFIPNTFKENINDKLKAFPYIIPTNIDLNKDYKDMRTYNVIDLSSKQLKKGEELSLSLLNKGELIHELNANTNT